MHKLLVLPGDCDTFGGTLVSLSLLVSGFERNGQSQQICVLVRAGSVMEQYLKQMNQEFCLQPIVAESQRQFLSKAIKWVNEQPKQHPLLIDNCVHRHLLLTLLIKAPALRFNRRSIYHFCHDTAASGHFLGYFARKLIFSCISPRTLCNSQFTASRIRYLMPNICGILYQPVDLKRFNSSSLSIPPLPLKSILTLGFRVILIPSRISNPGINNDKNLYACISLLAVLKEKGHNYCGIIIGEDSSPEKINSQTLQVQAKRLGVADRFFILPFAADIENYYKFADIIVALAPREPFGRTVVEAIACGVPVVGSCTGGIGEILSQFTREWMVAPDEPFAVAEAIIQMSTNPNTSAILAEAQSWVDVECSAEAYARKMARYTNLSVDETSGLLKQ